MRALMLCADDFGLSTGIDQAIVALAQAGRIGAFSCLVNGPAWGQDAHWVDTLRRHAADGGVSARPTVQAGLHLNLTEGRPLSPGLARHWPTLPTLPRLIAAAHLGRLPLAALGDELAAQWQAFVDASGVLPDYLDGHQHVHHLPGLRQRVLALALAHRVPMRCTGWPDGPGATFKRWVMAATGGRALERDLLLAGLPHNRQLLGVYGLDGSDYRRRMRGWLAGVRTGGALLFCHPGRPSADGAPDAIAAARQCEFSYLAGEDFRRDLAEAGVVLAPVWR